MENEEIDLIEIVTKFWQKRKLIGWFVLVCMLAGVAISFILPRKYTARCILGLETEDRTTRISVEGMSAFQSMNMTDAHNTRIVSPSMYPDILFSVPFQKELIYTPLFVNAQGDSLSFYDYFIPEKERNKYIGENTFSSVEKLNPNEEKCLDYLKNAITAKIENKEGYFKLEVNMPDPQLAAELAHRIQMMLQNYIAKFRIAKAQAALDFIEERYAEVKRELEAKQLALVNFRERARNRSSVEIQAEEKILTNDYDLFFELYADITKQREKAKIQVKENMPILTVIEPVVVPSRPSQPKRTLIVLVSIFLGLFAGCGWVLMQPLFSHISANSLPSGME